MASKKARATATVEPPPSASSLRELLESGKEIQALRKAEKALEAGPGPSESLALHVLAAHAARALADTGLELAHWRAAEETAAAHVPGSLGAMRLQLGLAELRAGDPGEAERVLKDAVAVLGDDPAERARAETALEAARARKADRVSKERKTKEHHALLASQRVGRARVYRMLEKLYEADAESTVDAVLAGFLDELVAATDADRGFVLLKTTDGYKVRVARDKKGSDLVLPHVEVSQTMVRTAAEEGRTVVATRPAEDPRFASSKSARKLALKAVCAAPIRFRREPLGVVVLDRKESEGGFSKASELLAGDFARGAAGLIYRSRRTDAERAKHAAQIEEWVRDAERLRRRFAAPRLVGKTPGMIRVLELCEKAAARPLRVLIRGESGTGKEAVARTIHENSDRKTKPFVAVNCAAMAEDVLESELFGHAAGAFTGAAQASKGLFRSAHGGTLFLDEIGSASPKVQGTLLRVIEDGVVRPLGSDEDHKVDVRLISATNEDLEDLVASGSFRDDLFYRLNALTIVLPPLRERRDDIPLLARHFVLEALGKDEDRADDVLTRTVVARLLARDWPGNVRELKNTIETLVSLGELPAAEKRVRRREIATGTPVWKEIGEPVPTLREAEFRTICAALTACEGNKLKAARMLGISRRGLYYLLEAHGLDGEIVRRD